MRGQRIYKEIIKGNGLEKAMRKGRNSSLLTKRNECLFARYYYYCWFKNRCYEEALRLLVSEFFISPSTISMLITSHTEDLQALKQKSPTLYFFQNRWPHLKW